MYSSLSYPGWSYLFFIQNFPFGEINSLVMFSYVHTNSFLKWFRKSWKSSIVSCRQSRRLLDCIRDKFLSQAIDSCTRKDAVLDLLLTSSSELIDDIRIGGCLVEWWSSHSWGISDKEYSTENWDHIIYFSQFLQKIWFCHSLPSSFGALQE